MSVVWPISLQKPSNPTVAHSGSSLSSPPWNSDSLQNYCETTNQNPGQRGVKYEKLLNALGEKLSGQSAAHDFDTLGLNLLCILRQMPDEIKNRENIEAAFAKTCFFQASPTSLQFLRDFCSHINSSVGIRTVTYQEMLERMESLLLKDLTFPQLESMGRRLTLVANKMPLKIKEKSAIAKKISTIENLLARSLNRHCLSINRGEKGNLIAAYREILHALETAAQLQATFEESNRLNRHLTLTVQYIEAGKVPTGEIQPILTRIRERLTPQCRSYFAPLRVKLLEATTSDEVSPVQSQIDLINTGLSQKIDAPLKKEVESCARFASGKFFIRSFMEHLDNPSSLDEIGSTRTRKQKIYRILSIDGGGIRGIIPAKVLVKIEEMTGKRIANLFQLIGGTSTGGILSLGLTKPDSHAPGSPEYRAQDLLDIYTQEHHHIFRKNPSYQAKAKLTEKIQNPKYLAPELFHAKFGDALMSSALTDIVITANTLDAITSKVSSVALTGVTAGVSLLAGAFSYNLPIWPLEGMPRKVHLFTKQGLKGLSYSLSNLRSQSEGARRYSYPASLKQAIHLENVHDFSMASIAKTTSAAPGYFPPILHNKGWLLDGGVLQNNPSIPCVLEAADRGYRRENMFMLSLGTGVEPIDTPKADLETSLTSLWFQTTQPHDQEDSALTDLLRPGASHRLQYDFEGHAPLLDDTSPATIAQLLECGDELVEENGDLLREICKVLSPESA